jgi:hypothetical protein
MKIRNLFLAAMVVVTTGAAVNAQDGEKKEGGFGFKGGIGLSSLNFGNENQQYEDYRNAMKLGGMLGVTYEARIGNSFAIDVEALFANKGSQQKGSIGPIDYTLKNNIFTLDVPVSAKFYLGDNFNIYAGPYFSYIVGGRLKTITEVNGKKDESESSDYFSDEYKDIDGNSLLNRFDLGLNAGVEFVTDGGFGIGARFQQGFMDLTNDDYKGKPSKLLFADNKNVLNTGVQIYGIIRF